MILLNREPLQVPSLEFPILITGADKTGASHFSIALLGELYAAGNKVLFFSGYEMAKTSFKKIVGDNFDTERVEILEDANEEQLINALRTMSDINDRLIYIKNFDLYAPETMGEVIKFSKLLFMGNMETAKAKDVLESVDWKTKISFGRPEVEQYYGVMESDHLSGIVHTVDETAHNG
jgi:Mg/Co/Ni transporter MgtE